MLAPCGTPLDGVAEAEGLAGPPSFFTLCMDGAALLIVVLKCGLCGDCMLFRGEGVRSPFDGSTKLLDVSSELRESVDVLNVGTSPRLEILCSARVTADFARLGLQMQLEKVAQELELQGEELTAGLLRFHSCSLSSAHVRVQITQ